MTNQFFTEADIVSTYTLDEAIEDGLFADVTELAKEAGFKWQVLISSHVNDILNSFSPPQDYTGRLWDLLNMAKWAVKRSTGTEAEVFFKVYMTYKRFKKLTFKVTMAFNNPHSTQPTLIIWGVNESTDY